VTFQPAARLGDVGEAELVGCEVAGQRVLLTRVGDAVYAYEDRCAHMGVRLSEGRRNGTRLFCRAHYWEYDVETGCATEPSGACLRRFPVRIEDGRIFVDVDAATGEGA
jgi:nitrite reductase/ring-hydroxylating ferredoxin subunit